MDIISLIICIIFIGYLILVAIAACRKRIRIALRWIGLSILSVIATFGIIYVLQDLLPRLYEIKHLCYITVAAASLAFAYVKVLGAQPK
jgi:uncharacterized membrane protein (Fun14 family)